MESALLTHTDEPLPFKAGARCALSPNAVKVPVMAPATLLCQCQGAGKVACPRLSVRAAIGLDLDWRALVHALFLCIRKLRLRKRTEAPPDVTEREQSGMNPAQLGVEIGAAT
jgi:hypothetical protein